MLSTWLTTDEPAGGDAPLAIDGGDPLLPGGLPPAPSIAPADDSEPLAALRREAAARLDLPVEHVVTFGSAAGARRALVHSGLAAAGVVEPRDAEVIVPAVGAAPFAAAARDIGATVVPGDVDAATTTLSTTGLARAHSERSKLVLLSHTFGHPAAVDEIARAVDGRGIAIVENATDALGASLRDIPAGRMAEGAVVDLFGGSLLPATGEAEHRDGALLILRDRDQAERVRRDAEERGDLPTDAAARLALGALRVLDEQLAARRALAWELTLNLREARDRPFGGRARALQPMPHGRWIRHTYPRYVFRVSGALWQRDLDATLDAIRAEGVPCDRALAPALHRDAAVRERLANDERIADDRFPNAERLPGELIAIPLHAGMTSQDMARIASVLRYVERWSL